MCAPSHRSCTILTDVGESVGESLLPPVGASRLSAQAFFSNMHSQTFSKPHLSVGGVVQFLIGSFLVGLPVPPQKEPGHL